MAEMTNADLFLREFGIYATELWAMPEQQFLAWLNAPSAQRSGAWLVAKGAREPDYMECNRCRWIFAYYGGLEEEWNYCPHCGARMERE